MYIYKYVRKPSFIQYQIPDYWGDVKKTVFIMKKPKDYRKAKKTMKLQKKIRKKIGRPKVLNLKKYAKIPQFIIEGSNTFNSVKYLYRFPKITPLNLNLIDSPLTLSEKVLYQNVLAFQGFFDDLFFFNDLSYFDYIEAIINQQGIRTGAPSLHDMLIYEFARIHSGNATYAGFLRNFTFFGPNNFKKLLYEPDFIPNVQDFSRMFHSIPVDAFHIYFFQLIEEFYDYKLLKFKILIWDCQFVHSNSSDYKDRKTGKYSDQEAGIGRHNNKFLGVGYMISTMYLYCGDLIVPIFCSVFPANFNDKTIFHETVKQYYKSGLPYPKVVLADAGAYSYKNLELLAIKGIIPIINAPKNIKNQNVYRFKKNVHLNKDFIPSQWSDEEILLLYAIRTAIERSFSHNIQIYNARRMNLRGIEQAIKHRFFILILDLLKILTAYKTGRSDLFQTYSAFSNMKEGVSPQAIRYQLKRAGYKLLLEKEEKPMIHPKFLYSR